MMIGFRSHPLFTMVHYCDMITLEHNQPATLNNSVMVDLLRTKHIMPSLQLPLTMHMTAVKGDGGAVGVN
jgi:hypothetical protein